MEKEMGEKQRLADIREKTGRKQGSFSSTFSTHRFPSWPSQNGESNMD
jgi:hypothetical protein